MKKILTNIFLSSLVATISLFATEPSGNEGIYFDPADLVSSRSTDSSSAPSGRREPAYIDILSNDGHYAPLVQKSYAEEITEILQTRMQVDQINSGATELIELMGRAYKSGNLSEIEKFDTSLGQAIRAALAPEMPLIVTFVRLLGAAKATKLLGNDISPNVAQEFESMQTECKELMQTKIDIYRSDANKLQELFEHFTSAEVSRLLLEEYPDDKLNKQFVESAAFQAEVLSGTATDFEDFSKYYNSNMIRRLTNNLTEFTADTLQKVFNFLVESPSVENSVDDSFINALAESARVQKMLGKAEIVDPKVLASVASSLKKSNVFTKYPKVWFAIARGLTDAAMLKGSNAQHFEAVERVLESTIPSSGKKSSLGKRIVGWFKDHCRLTRFRLQLRSRFFLKDADIRYVKAIELVREFAEVQAAEQVISGQPASIEKKERLIKDVAFLLKKAGEKVEPERINTLAGEKVEPERINTLMYELYKIDPDGTLIYKNLIQQLGNKALRKQFMSILDQFQKGAKLIGASENETEDVTITSTGSVVTERAEQLLDAAPKRPVELKPQGRVRQVPLRTSVGLRPSSLEETTTGRKPSKLLEERQNLTTIQEEHEDHQGGGYDSGLEVEEHA